MERRRFLRYLATTTLLTVPACRRVATESNSTSKQVRKKSFSETRSCEIHHLKNGPGRVLNKDEWLTLEALTMRLLPTDKDPGAKEANCINFIDAQLEYLPVRNYRGLLGAGTRALNVITRQEFSGTSKSFYQLNVVEQDQVIEKLVGQRLGRLYGGQFVQIMLSLTLEGYFSHPLYGGNQDRIAWKTFAVKQSFPEPNCPYFSRAQS